MQADERIVPRRRVVNGGALMIFSLSLMIFFLLPSAITLNIDTNFPLVYKDPQVSPAGFRATYFGYTVLLYSDGNISWIQISAPRANDSIHPKILEPGLIYRCNIGDSCFSYVFDNQGNERHEDYYDRKDNQWLGGSMTIDPDLDLLAVCAPRWINQLDIDERLMEGVCYTSPASNNNYEAGDAYKNLPLIDGRYRTYKEPNWSTSIYYYGLGQAGMSAYFTKDKSTKRTELILGAPGILNWQGSVILLKDSGHLPGIISKRETRTGAMGDKIIPKATHNIREAPYFGYSVAAGYFFSNELLYVASAPRGNQNRGLVMVFRFPKESRENIREVQKLYFTDEVGGYFGAHLAVGDLNNDGYDDLLVSAPMLKKPTVYIYNGGPRGSLLAPKSGVKELVGGSSFGGNSRFGLSVVVADLDFDTYKEVLVGAPFADDGRGAVALWQGGPLGLKVNTESSGAPTIIYYASALYPYLRGFGISIAPPVDIDHNSYPDLAIGSFMSGHAVILRGRPIVTLKVEIKKSEIKKLLHDSKDFKVPFCLSYQSPTNLTTAIDVELTVSIDNSFKRAVLKGQPKTYLFLNDHVFQTKKTLKPFTPNCDELNILLKKRIMNYLDSIEISINASIIDHNKGTHIILIPGDNFKGKDLFNNMYPIADVGSDKYEAPFETDCGSDNICEADLNVNITTEGLTNKFIVGSNGTIQIKITVFNKAENSYMTRVSLILPSTTALARLPPVCSMKVNSTILCDMENPLKTNRSKSLILDIDMHDVSMAQNGQYLTFKAEALTSSKEINPADNKFQFNLFLAVEASLGIFGKSSEDEFSYEKTEDDHVSRELVKFLHLYEIQKFGASPVEEVLLKIKIPYGYQTKKGVIKFVKIFIPEGYHDGQPISCEKNDLLIPINDESDNNDSDDDESLERIVTRKKRHLDESFTADYFLPTFNSEIGKSNIQVLKRSKRFITVQENKNNSAITNLRENRTVRINCEQNEVVCTEIICKVGPFRRLQIVSRLLITMKADMSAIKNPVMGAKDILVITTDGTATISDITLDSMAITNISSVFVSSLPGLKVALWLIIVSVILGLLLLTLLIYGLMKAGFFERKKKEQLKALIEEAEDVQQNEEAADTWYEESLPDEDSKFEIDEKDLR